MAFIRRGEDMDYFPDSIFNSFYAMSDDHLCRDSAFRNIIKSGESIKKHIEGIARLSGWTYKDCSGFHTLSGEEKNCRIMLENLYLYLLTYGLHGALPARGIYRNLKKLYESYCEQGIKRIGISIDDSEIKWEKEMRKLKMPWERLRPTTKENCKRFMEAYNILGIPHIIFIGKDGKIVASGSKLRAEHPELKEILDRYLQMDK